MNKQVYLHEIKQSYQQKVAQTEGEINLLNHVLATKNSFEIFNSKTIQQVNIQKQQIVIKGLFNESHDTAINFQDVQKNTKK